MIKIQHLNPEGMRKNPAFTNVVVVSGKAKTVTIGLLDPVDATGALVGRGDLAAQTEQIFKNLELALGAAGARLEDVILWRIYIVQGQDLRQAAAVFQRMWGRRPNPPANTVVFVPAQAYPESLIGLEATAVIAE
jgi:enamine deaminase RidA (YjgF/YER057c/UK114 family)